MVALHIICLVLAIFAVSSVTSSPAKSNNESHSAPSLDPIDYLQTFGWLAVDPDNGPTSYNESEPAVIEALKNFQAFAGIDQTGVFDNCTKTMMSLPRCGETDTDKLDGEVEEIVGGRTVVDTSSHDNKGKSRRKRFVLQGTRWTTRELRYNISKYSKDLPPYEIDAIIATAFQQWENVANITFVRTRHGKIHLDIRFEKGYHGDEETFDGPGGTTAHAYFPLYGGAVHFDDDEDWTRSGPWGVNLFQVATHEIGHALGLEHSNVQESIMSPFYRSYRNDFRLHEDDIEAIQALYGKRVLTICDDPSIDAGTTMVDNYTYIFAGPLVYKTVLPGELIVGSPTVISVAFPGLPNNIDAAITRPNGVSYIFKGGEFWRLTDMKIDVGFPKAISEFFPGAPVPIDAAFVFSNDENIYFFQNSRYWKFDHRKTPSVTLEYPKPVYNWKGIPESGIDAAISMPDAFGNKFTYFFKGNSYWKFNDKSQSLFLTSPPYPRRVSMDIFGCKM